MAIHLKLILDTEKEKHDWEAVKDYLGVRSNTEALRSLIRQTARTAIQSKQTPEEISA